MAIWHVAPLRFAPAFRALGVCEHSWLGEIEKFILFFRTLYCFKISCFVLSWKSAVLSYFENRLFCPVLKIGCFVLFWKSAVLSRLKSAVLSRSRKFHLLELEKDYFCALFRSITSIKIYNYGCCESSAKSFLFRSPTAKNSLQARNWKSNQR